MSKYRLVAREYYIAKNAITNAIDNHLYDRIRTTIVSDNLRIGISNVLFKHFTYHAEKDLIIRTYHKALEQLEEEGFL